MLERSAFSLYLLPMGHCLTAMVAPGRKDTGHGPAASEMAPGLARESWPIMARCPRRLPSPSPPCCSPVCCRPACWSRRRLQRPASRSAARRSRHPIKRRVPGPIKTLGLSPIRRSAEPAARSGANAPWQPMRPATWPSAQRLFLQAGRAGNALAAYNAAVDQAQRRKPRARREDGARPADAECRRRLRAGAAHAGNAVRARPVPAGVAVARGEVVPAGCRAGRSRGAAVAGHAVLPRPRRAARLRRSRALVRKGRRSRRRRRPVHRRVDVRAAASACRPTWTRRSAGTPRRRGKGTWRPS